jgi:hypothetical protein
VLHRHLVGYDKSAIYEGTSDCTSMTEPSYHAAPVLYCQDRSRLFRLAPLNLDPHTLSVNVIFTNHSHPFGRLHNTGTRKVPRRQVLTARLLRHPFWSQCAVLLLSRLHWRTHVGDCLLPCLPPRCRWQSQDHRHRTQHL